MRHLILIAGLAALCLLSLPQSNAVRAQVAEDLQSHILFDIRVDRIRTFTEAHGLDLDQIISAAVGVRHDTGLGKSLNRVYGTIQLPRDMAAAGPMFEENFLFGTVDNGPKIPMEDNRDQKMEMKREPDDDYKKREDGPVKRISYRQETGERTDLPFNFFIRFDFVNAEVTNNFREMNLWPNPEPTEIDGKSFHLVPDFDESAPGNIAWWQPGETSLEIGTMEYLTQSTRRFFTPRLSKTWGSMSDQAVRLAVDLEGVATLVGELVALGSESVPAAIGNQLALINGISTLQLAVDPEMEDMVSLVINAKDSETAGSLQSTLSEYIGMAKILGSGATAEMEQLSPKAGKAAGEILQSLDVAQADNRIAIQIPRPDGMDEAVDEAVAVMKVQAQRMERLNNIRQVALSVHNFHDAYMKFPFKAFRDMSEDLSWRARVSPFCEGPDPSFQHAHDSPENSEFVNRMPGSMGSDGSNSNVVWIDNGDDNPTNFGDITDGMSATIMLLENPKPGPWMKPNDLTIDEAVTLITGLQPGETLVAVMYDGSARELQAGLDAEVVRAMLTCRGGEVVDADIFDR